MFSRIIRIKEGTSSDDIMKANPKFSEKFFASYEDLYGYLMSDSYIKENYIYEMLAVLLIYLGMPEEYIPIIEAASVDVKNKTISVGGIVFDNYPESFFELCELSFQDKQCCLIIINMYKSSEYIKQVLWTLFYKKLEGKL